MRSWLAQGQPAFVKVLYRQAASHDIVRQFRYYLHSADAPEPFVSVKPSSALFNHYARILTWVLDTPLAIREFKIFAHGLSLDLRLFGFITLWRQMRSTLFAFCTANAT